MGVLVGSWLMKVVLILVVSLFNIVTAATVQHLTWEVEYKRWSPDVVEGVVMAINGHFPGPTIRARAGDTINLTLINKLHTEGLVIHWHGIRQYGTPWADGTASISQCAISPGETYIYTFRVDKAGTYFYHGHYGMQRSAGLYGSLIVDVAEGETEKIHYNHELPMLLLSDWWHSSSRDQEVDLSSKPMTWVGEPQSLLINGRGRFGCSLPDIYGKGLPAACKLTDKDAFIVRPNQTYRLRIASSTALAALNFAIEDHKLTVVEADGNYVEPFTVDNIDIYSGESYSVIFTTNQNPSTNKNYWISVTVRGREPHTPPALAILHYNITNKPPVQVFPPLSAPPVGPRWNYFEYSKAFAKKLLAAPGSPPPPPQHDRRIVLLNTQNYMDGHTKWSINNISLALPTTPYLGSIKYNLTEAFDQRSPPDSFDPNYDIMIPPTNKNTVTGDGLYTLEFNTTVDVILQNANVLKEGTSEIHPWHLHGHDFWVLGYGEGKFTEDKAASFNLKNPPLKNTAVIFPYGWTALRFKADNPGVWAFHCHIEPHLHLGMGVVFAEGVHLIRNMSIPNEDLACGLTAKYFMNDGKLN